jgi:hypothetical protein
MSSFDRRPSILRRLFATLVCGPLGGCRPDRPVPTFADLIEAHCVRCGCPLVWPSSGPS